MSARRFFAWFARLALVLGATTWLAVGCSRQGEGERCDVAKAASTDCDEGLSCIGCSHLVGHVTDRCCPPTPGTETDARCHRSNTEVECTSPTATGGTGGAGGTNMGGTNTGGTNTGGTGATSGTGTAGGEAGAGGN